MATEEQLDATCRRLRATRLEIFELAHTLKGDRPQRAGAFPRSRIMRALTGGRGRRVLGSAAIALAISRPKAAARLAALVPLMRPMILRFLTERFLRSRRPTSVAATE
jgi:hypothetical protein